MYSNSILLLAALIEQVHEILVLIKLLEQYF